MRPTPHRRVSLGRLSLLLMLCTLLVGCDEQRFDASKLREGMDRSAIIAHYGPPDARKKRDDIERLTYLDGEHYQYLLMLVDGKLQYWQQDRVYQGSGYHSPRD